MIRFIVLTNKAGTKLRINVSHIVSYNSISNAIYVMLTDGSELLVAETPEEIDAILINNGILVHSKDN